MKFSLSGNIQKIILISHFIYESPTVYSAFDTMLVFVSDDLRLTWNPQDMCVYKSTQNDFPFKVY